MLEEIILIETILLIVLSIYAYTKNKELECDIECLDVVTHRQSREIVELQNRVFTKKELDKMRKGITLDWS